MRHFAVLGYLCYIFIGRGSDADVQTDPFLNDTFPLTFLWGTATSAYQIEGAWNEDGEFAVILFQASISDKWQCATRLQLQSDRNNRRQRLSI